LVEYVKWITQEATALRKRLRAAEGFMSTLRKRGEMSVEECIKTLTKLKKKSDALEAEAEELRDDLQFKEDVIDRKEKEREKLDQAITNETADHNVALSKMNKHLED
jgi:predicted  nucleic acid-binding Zn-ribbon protein